MPEIYPSKIISYSSEDKSFPAENLLKSSSFTKWRSEKGGSKQEVVELGFDQPVEINRLDIGNNGSAFIEVLVRRSASSDDPTVLLPSSSFLSPTEAKNETNLNRVRVFSGDELQTSVTSKKWDLFRFVCTQPFNKNLPYGMSFVSFHSPALKTESGSTRVNSSFVELNDDQNEPSSDLQPGALFRASKQVTATPEMIPAAKKSLSVAEKLLLTKQQHSNPSPVSCPPSTSNSHAKSELVRPSRTGTHPSTSTSKSSSKENSAKRSSPSSHRRPLENVVFSLSGYQNPQRSDLRQKAIELGAKFRQNWCSDCTHLICAFVNTPKFKEVKGKGIIVSEKWIEECYRTRSKVNWRPYRLGRAPSPPVSSEGHSPTPADDQTKATVDDVSSTSSSEDKSSKRKQSRKDVDDEEWKPEDEDIDEDDDADEEYQDESVDESSTGDQEESASENNHESRRKRKADKQGLSEPRVHKGTNPPLDDTSKCSSPKRKHTVAVNPEDEDTDEEIERVLQTSPSPASQPEAANRSLSPAHLPDLFTNKHFFVHSKDIPKEEVRILERLIVAFNGTLHQYMHPDVQYAVTRSPWMDEFDEALSTNPTLIFVRPEWIFACDQQAKWIPFQKYLVVG